MKGPLFPGRSCYPISPCTHRESVGSIDPEDQLNTILKILGSPKQDDIEFLMNESAQEYVKSVYTCQAIELKKLYPDVEGKYLTFLRSMLEFDPRKRPNTETLLKDEIFSHFNQNEQTISMGQNDDDCLIDFETEEFYLVKRDLNLLFMREISHFRSLNDPNVKTYWEVLLDVINKK